MTDSPKSSLKTFVPVWSRKEVLLTCIVLMLILSSLFPWESRASIGIDIVWILSICLSAATVLICLSARSSSQLEGLGPLLVAQGFFQLFLAAGLTRLLLSTHSCGKIIHKISGFFDGMSYLSILPIALLLGICLILIVFRVLRAAAKTTALYFSEILPFKKLALSADQNLQILTDEQAQILSKKINSETSFFASFRGVKFLFCCLIILFFLLPVSAHLFTILEFTLRRSQEFPSDLLNHFTAVFTAAALSLWFPLSLSAIALSLLLHRKEIILPKPIQPQEEPEKRTIRIPSRVADKSEEMELLNPDFTTQTAPVIESVEQVAEFEPDQTQDLKPERLSFHCSDTKEYYQTLAEILKDPRFNKPITLLTADSSEDLPVTVGVHTALAFAKENQKILLIDLDQRCAVSKVFDMPTQTLQEKPQQSTILNFSLFSIQKALSISKLMQKTQALKESYDRIFVYGPGLKMDQSISEFPVQDLTVLLFTDDPKSITIKKMDDLREMILCVTPLKTALKN